MRHFKKLRNDYVITTAECRTMADEIRQIELIGGEIPTTDAGDYMFTEESQIDMDANCNPYLSRMEYGAADSSPIYADKYGERMGIESSSAVESSNVNSSE